MPGAPVQSKGPQPGDRGPLSAVQGAGARRRRHLQRLRVGHARPVPGAGSGCRPGGRIAALRERAHRRAGAAILGGMSLFGRVVAINARVLVAAALALALSPATRLRRTCGSRRPSCSAIGTVVVLAVNLLLVRRVFGPLERLTAVMRRIDPYAPGRRLALDGADAEVAELRDAFNAMLDRLEDERRSSGRRALAAQEGERSRIARELHDEIGQTLTGVVLQLEGAAARRAATGCSPRSRSCRRRPAPAWRTCARSRAACGPRRSTSSGCAARSSRSPPRSPTAAACACARSWRRAAGARARARPRDLPRRPGEPDQRRAPRGRP